MRKFSQLHPESEWKYAASRKPGFFQQNFPFIENIARLDTEIRISPSLSASSNFEVFGEQEMPDPAQYANLLTVLKNAGIRGIQCIAGNRKI